MVSSSGMTLMISEAAFPYSISASFDSSSESASHSVARWNRGMIDEIGEEKIHSSRFFDSLSSFVAGL